MARGRDDDGIGIGARLLIGGVAGLAGLVALRRLSGARARPFDPADLIYGAGCGALLAAASPRPGTGAGAAAGGAFWLAGEMGWAPPLAASASGNRAQIVILAGHVGWGIAAAAAIRHLGDIATGD